MKKSLPSKLMIACHSRREMEHGEVCVYALEYLECEYVKVIEDMSVVSQIDCACVKIPFIKSIC